MSKAKSLYVCTSCGAESTKWAGQCGDCGAWNTMTESVREAPVKGVRGGGYSGQAGAVTLLNEVSTTAETRVESGLSELDRVLGGGLVAGSVVLIGGDPGIGKSTILLQTLTHLAQSLPALYVTGEESLAQVAMRARRLELPMDRLKLMAETSVENIIATAREQKPR
ncbi:MAG TPA: ATPase domain-containing protein, partial [Moraxellaceae bacterium]|nr:ATPase domain-containing protein [Moraxellaceae bacterium]